MKWFQHSTDSYNDPDISDAEDLFGDAGYSVFFKILEIYGREFNSIDSEGKLNISCTFVRRKLRKSWTKVEQILNFYQTKNRIFFEINNDNISLYIPKFLKKADNWTRRIIKPKNNKLCSNSVATTAIEEEEKEKKKKNTNKKESQKVLGYLNNKTRKNFTDISFIIARLNEGKTIDECITIIDNQSRDEYFISNPKYMNPQTLFCPKHWDKYLNNIPHPLQGKVSEKTIQNIQTLKNWRPKNEKPGNV